MFKQIEGEFVVLFTRGVYKHVGLFRRDQDLFASHGGGYIRLLEGRGTSQDRVSWDQISITDYTTGSMGRLLYLGEG